MSTRTVETVLRVRDEMTPAMLKAGASAGKLATDVERAGKSVDTLGKANTAGLAGGMDKTALAAGKLDTATRRAGSSFGILSPQVAAAGLSVAALGKSVIDFDKNMSAVKANSGATAQQLDALRQKAIELGAASQYSGAEAAAGMNELLKAGMSAESVLNGGLKGALDLAAAGQMDVARAAELAATATQQFAGQGVSATHVADLYAAAANKAQGSVEDIGQAMKYAGVAANGMGISVEETTGTIALFATKGIIGEQAGTSFRSMLMSLTAPSAAAKKEMDALGISVYDGQGKFVGMAGVAEQLKTQVGSLSEAERNAALGRIFGNESIGAAIALMEGGSSAVQQWTKDVNDSGIAARQAADLTDNLAGDFERFMGAIDGAALKGSGGLNESLRGLTQGATALVEAMDAVPGPVLQGAAALAVMHAAGRFLPNLGPQFTTTRTAVKGFGDEMRLQQALAVASGQSVGTFGAALGTIQAKATIAGGALGALKVAGGGLMAALGGPWGIAIGVAGLALGAFAQHSADAKAKQEELKGATDSLTSTLVASGGAWTQQASEQLVQLAQQQNLIGNYQAMGYSIETITSALTQEGAARQQVISQVDAKIAALKAEEDAYYAANGVQNAAAASERQYYEQQRANLAEAITVGSQAAAAAKLQAAANTAAGEAAKAQATGQADANEKMGEAQKLAKGAADAIKGLADTVTGAMNAQSAYHQAVESLNKELPKLAGKVNKAGTEFDLTTETGRKAQSMLLDVGNASREAAQRSIDLGKGVDVAEKQMASARRTFVKQAQDLGLNSAAANKLADELGLTKQAVQNYATAAGKVPKKINTDVNLNGIDDATEKLQALAAKLGGMDNSVYRATFVTEYVNRGYAPGMVKAASHATGGPIIGPGTATSDSIPALLSNGEHVLTAAEVKAAGGQASILRLRKAMLAGDVPRFATGGPVGATGSASLQQAVITAALGSGRNAVMVDVTANITKVIAPTKPVEIAAIFQWDAKTKAMLAGPNLAYDIAGLEAPKMSPNVAALMSSWGSVLQTVDAAVQDQAALDQRIRDAAKGLQEAEDVLAQAGADLAKAQATYPNAAADAAFRSAESAAKDAKNARANAAEELGEWRKAKTDITKAQREYVKAQASLAALTKANASFERLAPARSKVKVTKKAVDDAKALVAQEQREYAAARKVATIAGQQEKTARAKWTKEQAKGGASGGKSGSVSYSGALGSSAAKPYRAAIIAAGAKYGVAPELLAAQLKAESGFNPKARSHAGARGIAQFMPGTARGVGLKNPLDPIASINAQAKLMGGYAKTYKGDIAKMLAAYNAGPGNVKRWQKIGETRNYVAKIKADAGVKSMGKAANTYNPKAIAKATSGGKAGANPLVESMIDNAQKLVGRYYKWGGGHAGNSHKSNLDKALVDCSGLINTALGHTLKKNVNRVAKDWTKGKGVKKLSVAEALKTRGAFLGTDTHVVMSLGDGRVIEAPQTGKKVRISSAKGRKFSRGGWYTGLGTPGAAGATGKGGAFNTPGYNATARGDALEVLDPRKAKESRDQAKAARDAKVKELADAKKAAAENARRAAQVGKVRAEMEKALPQIAALAIAGDEATKALEENKKAQDELRPTFDALKGALDKAKEAAKQFGDSIASAITGASSVGKLWTMDGGGNRSPESIAMQRGIDITNAKKFAADIDKLSKLGLNKTDLADIMTMGVNDGGALAHSIVSSSSSAILGLNRSREELDEVAAKIGAAFGQDIYGEQIADATADLAPIAAGMDILVKESAGLTKLISDLEAQRLKIGEAVAGKIDALIGVQRTQGTELQRMWQQWMGSYGLNAKSAPGLTGVGTARPTLAPPARPVQVTVQPAKVDLNGARLVIHTDKGGFEATVTNVIAAAVQQAQVKAGGGVR